MKGKTVTQLLTYEQVACYGSWFTNDKSLHSALKELEELPIQIVQ